MPKLIAASIVLALLTAGVKASWDAAYQSGADAERTRQSASQAEQRTAEKAEVKEVIRWRNRERVVYRDRIQTIHTTADPTGCLGTDLRDVGLGSMLPAPATPDSN